MRSYAFYSKVGEKDDVLSWVAKLVGDALKGLWIFEGTHLATVEELFHHERHISVVGLGKKFLHCDVHSVGQHVDVDVVLRPVGHVVGCITVYGGGQLASVVTVE